MEAPSDAKIPATTQDHDILDDLEREVGSVAARRRLAAIGMRATRQLPMSDTPDQPLAIGSKRTISEAKSPAGRRPNARKAARESLAENVSNDQATYGKITRPMKRKDMVRFVTSDDSINESAGDTQGARSMQKRSMTGKRQASPGPTPGSSKRTTRGKHSTTETRILTSLRQQKPQKPVSTPSPPSPAADRSPSVPSSTFSAAIASAASSSNHAASPSPAASSSSASSSSTSPSWVDATDDEDEGAQVDDLSGTGAFDYFPEADDVAHLAALRTSIANIYSINRQEQAGTSIMAPKQDSASQTTTISTAPAIPGPTPMPSTKKTSKGESTTEPAPQAGDATPVGDACSGPPAGPRSALFPMTRTPKILKAAKDDELSPIKCWTPSDGYDMCKVHTEERLYISVSKYGHAMSEGLWCLGDRSIIQ